MAPMTNTQPAWVHTERLGLGGGRNGTQPFIKCAFENPSVRVHTEQREIRQSTNKCCNCVQIIVRFLVESFKVVLFVLLWIATSFRSFVEIWILFFTPLAEVGMIHSSNRAAQYPQIIVIAIFPYTTSILLLCIATSKRCSI